MKHCIRNIRKGKRQRVPVTLELRSDSDDSVSEYQPSPSADKSGRSLASVSGTCLINNFSSADNMILKHQASCLKRASRERKRKKAASVVCESVFSSPVDQDLRGRKRTKAAIIVEDESEPVTSSSPGNDMRQTFLSTLVSLVSS